ncbi:MAG: cupin domain-containing protein [Bacteroidales bacterium]|jgi:mannose-6-phosphate isomerase-like protein (cupin superfamily)|nr:cupin domain-containing protein [Bacteroidales bacterium]MCK9499795.1 cupin domain-containing protein [Bacteroidales bacterium]MDY0315204.1 cupin domain-containing protein [Bacteroidales bacterium]NLB85442.1 cupin domain-containing protein [Bacteroidales bacterium]
MKKIIFKNAEKRENPFNADVRVLNIDDKTEFLHLELEPGKSLAKVKIDIPAYFYILEGKPEVIIDDKTEFAEKDEFIVCPAGSYHCINNPGDVKARILVVKSL